MSNFTDCLYFPLREFIFKNSWSSKVPKNDVIVSIHPQMTDIPIKLFHERSLLTSIKIPSSVIVIGDEAFSGCSSLTSIIIPENVSIIRPAAFCGCSSLKSISIPKSITTIEESTFSGCSSLTSISIPENVSIIKHTAFSGCSSLTSIRIPSSVSTIGYSAFRECSSLASISIPSFVSIIGYSTFRGCSSLTSINIPDTILIIGPCAFMGCSSLTIVEIPPVTEIKYSAFSQCHALEQRQSNGCNYHQDVSTWLRRRFDNLPLHQICYDDTSLLDTTSFGKFLLMQQHTSVFTLTDAMLMTPLHVLCCNPTASIEMIQQLKAAQPRAALMKNIMNQTPLMMFLELKSKRYNIFHQDGQLLPLVELLEKGLDVDALEMVQAFDDEMFKSKKYNIFYQDGELLPLVELLEKGLDVDALEMVQVFGDEMVTIISEIVKRDDTSGLLPFMYSASLANCKLNVVYQLAMKFPHLLTMYQSNDKVPDTERRKMHL